jgi:anti-sigma regulatory factor (Ser/Thr protein kinase)
MSPDQLRMESPDGIATSVPQLRLLVPPDPKEAQAVRGRVASFIRGLGVPEDALFDVVTVIGEAFANVVQHAGTREAIELTTWLEDGTRLLTRIVDRGHGFDASPATLAPQGPADTFSERGRGIWIMNQCADLISVDSIPGLGTAVVFAREIGKGPAAANRNG